MATVEVPPELALTEADFARVSSLAERLFGISLPPDKRLLVARRLRGPVQRAGYGDFASWAAAHLREPLSPGVVSQLADVLTTNHTYFWREPEHFVNFRDHTLPERIRAHQQDRDLRVWCAASATGEEPYQIAMILRDTLVDGRWTAGLLATDLSGKALQSARDGEYSADRLASLPKAWREKYVDVHPDGSGTMSPKLKQDITFRRLNLLHQPWRFRVRFDVIFCRNVLIYFEGPVRDRVVTGLVEWLAPGGVLYVGHAEALPRKWPLSSLGPGIWRRVEGR